MNEKKRDKIILSERHEDILEVCYDIDEILLSKQSAFQEVCIAESVGYGKMLFLDEMVMISERDEHIYHEMIAHVPLFVHPDPRRVLIIGGGDGGTAREVLRHPTIESVTLVEIDEVVIEGCRKFIPATAKSFDHPKMTAIVDDGAKFVKETRESFDIVIVDSTDPIGPSLPLFGEEFYANIHRILTESGIVVSQAESPYYYLEVQKNTLGILKRLFKKAYLYNYSNLTYLAGLWSFSLATKGDLCPIGDFVGERYANLGLSFKYYNNFIHRAAFVLPEFQHKEMRDIVSPFKMAPIP